MTHSNAGKAAWTGPIGIPTATIWTDIPDLPSPADSWVGWVADAPTLLRCASEVLTLRQQVPTAPELVTHVHLCVHEKSVLGDAVLLAAALRIAREGKPNRMSIVLVYQSPEWTARAVDSPSCWD